MRLWRWICAQFVSVASAVTAEGTKSDPIVLGYGDGDPCKYECPYCHRWFIEPWGTLVLRDGGADAPWNCEDCAHRRRREEWERVVAADRAAWKRITEAP